MSPTSTFTAHPDSANGVSLHPLQPLLATASGQRRFNPPELSDSDSDTGSDSDSDGDAGSDSEKEHDSLGENTLKIWSLPPAL